MLPVSLLATWPLRDEGVFWAIVDFNEGSDLQQWMIDTLGPALGVGHIRYYRVHEPWTSFHVMKAKNTAHVAAASEAGGDRPGALYVVNVDNDNVLTCQWLRDARRAADAQVPAALRAVAGARRLEEFPSLEPLFTHWNNQNPGVFGRMGLPYTYFRYLGGYDESMEGMGYEDVDLKRRASRASRVEDIDAPWCGFSVPNAEENQGIMRTVRDRRSQRGVEESCKNRFINDQRRTYKAMNDANRKLALQENRPVRANGDLPCPGVSFYRLLPLEDRKQRGAAAGVDRPVPPPADAAPVIAVSFGTRTLCRTKYSSASAEELHRVMWQQGDRRMPTQLGRDAVELGRDAVEMALRDVPGLEDADVWLVSCTTMHWPHELPREKHVGTYPATTEAPGERARSGPRARGRR